MMCWLSAYKLHDAHRAIIIVHIRKTSQARCLGDYLTGYLETLEHFAKLAKQMSFPIKMLTTSLEKLAISSIALGFSFIY